MEGNPEALLQPVPLPPIPLPPIPPPEYSRQSMGEGTVDDEAFLYGKGGGPQNSSQVRLGKRGPPELPTDEGLSDEQYYVVDSTPHYGPEGYPSEGQMPDRQGHRGPGQQKKKRKKSMMQISPEMEERMKTISSEQVIAENKQRIMVVDNLSTGHFLCTVCSAPVNCIKNLETHIRSLDHIRRTKMFLYSKAHNTSFGCDLCSISCPNGSIYEQHIMGKKHAKMLENKSMHAGNVQLWPISENLDILFKEEVVREGTGLTLGVTPTMMSLLKLEGPFIGLQYAQEIGTEDEKCVPNYFCTLCDVLSEAFNFHLHYASSFHRTNVLKKDYLQEYESLQPYLNDESLSRGQVNAKVKEVAQAIESREGRKVEVIKRKIVVRPNIKGIGEKKSMKHSARGGTSSRGRGGGPSGRGGGGNAGRGGHGGGGRGRGTFGGPHQNAGNSAPGSQGKRFQFGKDPINNSPLGQAYGGAAVVIGQQSSNTSARGQKKRRGNRGGGGNPSNTSAAVPKYGPQGVSTSYGGYGGDEAVGGRSWRQEDRVPLLRGRGGKGKRGRGRDDYGYGYESSSYPSFDQGSYSTLDSSSFMSTPTEPLPNMINVAHLMTMEKLKTEGGDKTDAYKKLALQMIKTEEDAEQAFQLSSALTQALLEYRMKSFSSLMPDVSPISSLLNLLQKPQP